MSAACSQLTSHSLPQLWSSITLAAGCPREGGPKEKANVSHGRCRSRWDGRFGPGADRRGRWRRGHAAPDACDAGRRDEEVHGVFGTDNRAPDPACRTIVQGVARRSGRAARCVLQRCSEGLAPPRSVCGVASTALAERTVAVAGFPGRHVRGRARKIVRRVATGSVFPRPTALGVPHAISRHGGPGRRVPIDPRVRGHGFILSGPDTHDSRKARPTKPTASAAVRASTHSPPSCASATSRVNDPNARTIATGSSALRSPPKAGPARSAVNAPKEASASERNVSRVSPRSSARSARAACAATDSSA